MFDHSRTVSILGIASIVGSLSRKTGMNLSGKRNACQLLIARLLLSLYMQASWLFLWAAWKNRHYVSRVGPCSFDVSRVPIKQNPFWVCCYCKNMFSGEIWSSSVLFILVSPFQNCSLFDKWKRIRQSPSSHWLKASTKREWVCKASPSGNLTEPKVRPTSMSAWCEHRSSKKERKTWFLWKLRSTIKTPRKGHQTKAFRIISGCTILADRQLVQKKTALTAQDKSH